MNIDLKDRTKKFALRVIRMTEALPRNRVADVLAKQVLRSGTSVGANYRAACRAKSPKDFIAKMGIVEEECDETIYWMELLVESGQIKLSRVESLTREADELLRIVVASSKTARRNSALPSASRTRQ
ncbi:MAG TPA: four helix bundle protein [Verrucomicrobiae bacterium]